MSAKAYPSCKETKVILQRVYRKSAKYRGRAAIEAIRSKLDKEVSNVSFRVAVAPIN